MHRQCYILITVNGNWGDWTEWTDCSQTCGGGIKSRTRLCNKPLPKNGGSDCTTSSEIIATTTNEEGVSIEEENKNCNDDTCPTTTDSPGNTIIRLKPFF